MQFQLINLLMLTFMSMQNYTTTVLCCVGKRTVMYIDTIHTYVSRGVRSSNAFNLFNVLVLGEVFGQRSKPLRAGYSCFAMKNRKRVRTAYERVPLRLFD